MPVLRSITKDPVILARLEMIAQDLKKDIFSLRSDTHVEDQALLDHEKKYALFRSYIDRVQEENALMREQIHTLHTSQEKAQLVENMDTLLTRVESQKSLRIEARESYERFARDIMSRETTKFL